MLQPAANTSPELRNRFGAGETNAAKHLAPHRRMCVGLSFGRGLCYYLRRINSGKTFFVEHQSLWSKRLRSCVLRVHVLHAVLVTISEKGAR